MPTYDGRMDKATLDCLNAAMAEAKAKGWEATFLRWAGDGLIANARNGIVARFLASKATDLVFVDSDIAWDDGALIRLVEHEVDFVVGVYRYKKEPESYPLVMLDDGVDPRDKTAGLLRIALAPAGFMRLSRSCLERMVRFYADRVYQHTRAGKAWCLFDCGLRGEFYWGEDYTFCQRWRDIGGAIWADPYLTLHHWGFVDTNKVDLGRRAYSGCLAEWFKTKPTVKIECSEAA